MKKYIIYCTFFVLHNYTIAQHAIIPEPVSYKANGHTLTIPGQLTVTNTTKDKQATKYIDQFHNHNKKLGIVSSNKKQKNVPKLSISINKKPDQELGKEGYELSINEKEITLTANQAGGVFNGLQTIKQLLPAPSPHSTTSKKNPIKIAGCDIKDYPRFGWRGLMLDVSRHFFTVDEVKQYIDKMSAYKYNVFHWHLTDDNGWRIEIKSLPKLTEIGAWRVERFGRFGENRQKPVKGEKTPYGGFYTQEQIKEVVQYAADRNITIVPEIDVPGHSMAALASYPELATSDDFIYVSPGDKFAEWYGDHSFKMITENALNPIDEKVYEFLDKIFGEIAALFPGEYIHMGGDECYYGYWERNPKVEIFMKKNGIKSSEELQSYFVRRVGKIIANKGKKMIGWDEILQGGLADNAAVMSWRGMKGGIKAAQMQHKVVMTPTTYCYLDYSQGDHTVENWIYSQLSLRKTYDFEPVPDKVDKKYILGGQGNLWTEAIPTLPFAYYMTYPRAFSIAETLWSPKEKKNWDSFIAKTETHFERFDQEKINISKAVYEPIVQVYQQDGKIYCKLTNSIPDTEIYYTIDNTYPVTFGNIYNEPFEIPEGEVNLRTQTYRNGTPLGRVLIIPRTELAKRAKK